MEKKKVEIYLKVIVLLFILKKKNLQSDTVLLCFQKHGSLKNDKM